MIKTIIFDMDGVLIEAKEWHYEALNFSLVKFGINPISLKDHLSTFDGLPTKQKLNMLEHKYNINLKDKYESINKVKQEKTLEIANKELCFDEIKIKMFIFLKEKGYKIGCCSNSISSTVNLFLKKSGIIDFFDIILSNEDVSKPKPNSEIYKKGMLLLQSEPHETLIFEDNINGIKAAKDSLANVIEVKCVKDVDKDFVWNSILKTNNEKI